MTDLRALPSVEHLLQTHRSAELIAMYGRPLVLEAIRVCLAGLRSTHQDGAALPDPNQILELVQTQLQNWLAPTLVAVINATGVVLHTNLGRAPLSKAALQSIQNLNAGYNTLEISLETGQRGSRAVHTESLLQKLSGAEAALVVNNNAAAVLLCLAGMAAHKRVVISRTQLVEIGGGFRVPDVMRQSGAKLVEVGTTNRVHLADYEEALQEPAAAVMRAHPSNFKIIGFTSEPGLAELVETAHRRGAIFIDDLGSGACLDTSRFGLQHEPMVQESVAAGADLVCFSGDKLLGGPQCGIILGRADLIQKLKKHPLARAVRADKLCLAALAATVIHYLKDEAEREIPVWQMIACTPAEIKTRAERWAAVLGRGEIRAGLSTVGGGSLPGETLPTFVLALPTAQPKRLMERLRKLSPPIIARVEDQRVLLDPRTVFPEQEGALLVGLQSTLS